MFEVGDVVIVKDDAYKIKGNPLAFLDEMKIFCGKEFTVCGVEHKNIRNQTWYCLNNAKSQNHNLNGDGYYRFVEDWLEIANKLEIEESDFNEILCLK